MTLKARRSWWAFVSDSAPLPCPRDGEQSHHCSINNGNKVTRIPRQPFWCANWLERASERALKTMPALPCSAKLIRKWFFFSPLAAAAAPPSSGRHSWLEFPRKHPVAGWEARLVRSHHWVGRLRGRRKVKKHTHPVLLQWPSLCFCFLFLSNAWQWNGPASRFASRAASTQPEVATSCRHASHSDCRNCAFELSAFLLID